MISNTFLRAKSFLDYYDIPYGKAMRLPLRRDTETGFLLFSINDDKKTAPEQAIAPEAANRDGTGAIHGP